MIQRIAFASCYAYSPAGDSRICARSRLLRALLKEADAHFMTRYAERVHEQMHPPSVLAGFFLSDDVLIPVPRSAPKTGGAWPAAELAHALVKERRGLRNVARPAQNLRSAQIGNFRQGLSAQR